ncbi:MAG: tripartite tricarboxylate transporter TctB family protein [Pseudomonadota bacterium]
MALDRWIALMILMLCLAYGYAAFFTMDGQLPPFMKRNPVWPSSFPKMLSILGALTALFVLLGIEKTNKPRDEDPSVTVYRKLYNQNWGQALILLGLMVAYALTLRPLGFFIATIGFLVISSTILGERKFHILIPVAVTATTVIWYLVQQVLGIFLSPWPTAFGG